MRLSGTTFRCYAQSLVFFSFVLGVAACGAFAGTITFNVSGTFTDGAVLSGTMTVDNVAGQVTAANFSIGAPISQTFSFVEHDAAYAVPGYWFVQTIPAGATVGSLPDFNLILPTDTLVGYQGGSLSPLYTSEVSPGGATVFLQSGQASPQTGTTVTYSGSVVSTGAPGFQVPTFAVGMPFQVTFTYDPSTPNAFPDPNVGNYYNAVESLSFSAGAGCALLGSIGNNGL